MNKKIYGIVTKIPFVEMLLRLHGNARVRMSSQLMCDDDIMKSIHEYVQSHPNEVVTDNILARILKEK